MNSDKLAELRSNIDNVDAQLLRLLNERAGYAEAVAEVKQISESKGQRVIYRPEREALLVKRLQQLNAGPLSDEHVERLFREIVSCCRSLEESLTVAYLGPKGTYTEAATLRQFGHFVSTKSQTSIADVFREVASRSCHYGVIPVENSTEGVVNHTLDCFMESELRICGEVSLPIHHALLVPKALVEEDIQVIYSHEQSFAQCREWLESRLPDIELEPVHSNAEAAKLASQSENAAAIAGELTAELYDLEILHTQIEDKADNTTRFLVIGDQETSATGEDKTSILVATQNIPGALFKVLSPFQERDISLTRIESRPSKLGAWTYVFFIDFDGHETDEVITEVLEEVRLVSVHVRVLGSYPRLAA